MILLRNAGMGLTPPAMLFSRMVGSPASRLPKDRWEERTFALPLENVLRMLLIWLVIWGSEDSVVGSPCRLREVTTLLGVGEF